MSYHANTTLSLGLGFTYRSVSLSFSHALNFLKSDERKGQSNTTDLQLRIYKRKWAVDAIASFCKGYYLTPQGLATPNGEGYYIRPDLGLQLCGASIYRILNDKKFTYGATLSPNAWQKKSAGSFLIGADAFYVATNADSSFVPSVVDSQYSQRDIRKLHLFEIGPGAGYAYTLVVRQHFFLMGSFNIGVNLSYSREISENIGAKFGIWGDYTFRIGAGYNDNKWHIGLSWIANHIDTEGSTSDYKYMFNTGGYRLVYSRRFALNRDMKRILN
jgi:hypothetical protein